MHRKRVTRHLTVWFVVFVVFWLATRQFHPTLALALFATMILIGASASAVYINAQFLLSQYARRGVWWYAAALLTTIAALDLIAVSLIQFLYDLLWGPDPNRFGFWFNVSSDGAIIVVPVAAAALLMRVAAFRRVRTARSMGEF